MSHCNIPYPSLARACSLALGYPYISMFPIETNCLSNFGLKAFDNNKGHVSIIPIEGKGTISDKELGE